MPQKQHEIIDVLCFQVNNADVTVRVYNPDRSVRVYDPDRNVRTGSPPEKQRIYGTTFATLAVWCFTFFALRSCWLF